MSWLGFSTGALAKDRLSEAVSIARDMHLDCIELSALRLRELQPLVEFVRANALAEFRYISLHAPTDYSPEQEQEVASTLLALAMERHWNVVVHPDCLRNYELWRPFGELLCIENMDKRKIVGRTVEELTDLFNEFPTAGLCFDIAHAHQVDTSMTEAYRILREFGRRVCQLHVSEVTSSSKHDRISESALLSYREVADQIPKAIPVILESPVSGSEAQIELEQAARIFEPLRIASRR